MKGDGLVKKNVYIETEFNEKYDKYCRLVYQTAYQYLFNIDMAEDVVQEAFVKLFINNKDFNDDEHEKAWLLRVTINLCKNVLKSKTYHNLELKCDSDIYENSFEESSNSKIDIMNQLKKLSAEQRTAIYLYYFERFNIKEISEVMKIKENTVKSHLKRAKQNLKINIEKEQKL